MANLTTTNWHSVTRMSLDGREARHLVLMFPETWSSLWYDFHSFKDIKILKFILLSFQINFFELISWHSVSTKHAQLASKKGFRLLSPFWRAKEVSKWKKSAWYNFLFSAVYLFVSAITSGIISPQEKANYDINWIENDKLKGLLCMPVSANWISEKM